MDLKDLEMVLKQVVLIQKCQILQVIHLKKKLMEAFTIKLSSEEMTCQVLKRK